MAAKLLEHFNIRTVRFAATVQFYTEVLGLKNGHYPGRILPGAWIYDENDVPVVHIIDLDPLNPEMIAEANAATVARSVESLHGSGAIDHVAFRAEDYAGFRARLDNLGVTYKASDVQAGLRQIYVMDPNNVLIELNFREDVS